MNAYAELPVAFGPALLRRGLWPWLMERRRAMRLRGKRMRVLGEEVAWAGLEPLLEPDRYETVLGKARAMQVFCRRLCRTHGIVPQVLGSFPLEPTIVVSNHLSYLDPIVVLALRPCSPIAKREVSGWPVLGGILEQLGINFVQRGNPMSGAVVLRKARRALDQGVSVLNFPEGTTTHGEHVLPFHRGIFGLAKATGTSVTPVGLRFEERDAAWVGDEGFVPHYLRQSARRSTPVAVNIGESIDPDAYASAESMAAALRSAVRALA